VAPVDVAAAKAEVDNFFEAEEIAVEAVDTVAEDSIAV